MKKQLRDIVRESLLEDLGKEGDVTTNATVCINSKATAILLAKSDGVVAGYEAVESVFAEVDKDTVVEWKVAEGSWVPSSTIIGKITGSSQAILSGERVALNLMQRMSGIATMTRRMVKKIESRSSHSKLLDTRKTVPLLRCLDKAAVRIGGGFNHRFGLYDMAMIKDNHISAAGSLTNAVHAVEKYRMDSKSDLKIEVEVSTLDEVHEACALIGKGVDRIMLDNMVKLRAADRVDTSMLSAALEIVKGRVETEASGNVTLETIGDIAAANVDFISSGALTHSVTAMDISLKLSLESS